MIKIFHCSIDLLGHHGNILFRALTHYVYYHLGPTDL